MKPRSLSIISILILLLSSLACQAGGPLAAIFATETPTPTLTPTSTPTPTNTPTPSPTPTLTLTPTPIPEAFVEQLAGGSTQFTDIKGGYRFTLPEGWLVINLAIDDPQQALDDVKKANPDKAVYLEGLNMAVAQKARMAAVDFAPDHYSSISAPFLFTVLDEKSKSMPLETILKSTGEVLPQLLNAKVTISKVKENQLGVLYGVIDVKITITSNGITNSVIEKLVMFKTEDYTVMITLAVSDKLVGTALPGFTEMIDSIELLTP
jgi:hypothetical protein